MKNSSFRHKKIPQNEDPGDCGVYSLMYIECLALERNFDGLNDQIITPLRSNLAADIYEEVTKQPNKLVFCFVFSVTE